MKKILLSFILVSTLTHAQIFPTETIISGGPNANRVNMVILGDGYTTAQQGDFINVASSSANYVFTKSPYKEYKNYFNVYAIKVESPESGVKHPGNATDVTEPVIPITNPNNYFGTTFDFQKVHRCVFSSTTNKVTQVLAANLPDFDIAYIIGNSPEYGGCGGTYAFLSAHTLADDIALHELGHSFGKLADEYWFSGSGESPNKTQNSDPATIKWKNWLETNSTGIYPYTESPTWFRPHQNCEMRYLNREFCSVCKQTIIERIHSLVSPIDSFSPSNSSSVNANSAVNFTVNEVLPIPNTLVNTWKLNGVALAETGNSTTINPSQLNVGNNSLLFSVTDDTSLLRVDNHSTLHVATVSWTLTKQGLGVTDLNATERRFTLYPNPAKNEVYIKGKQNFGKNVRVTLNDASGKKVPVKYMVKDDSTIELIINSLSKGIYILNVIENSEIVLSQKLIKE